MHIAEFKDYIAQLPLIDPPQAFGQHPNADIASAIQDAEELLGTILSLQPRDTGDGGGGAGDGAAAPSSAGASPEDKVMAVAVELERTLPPLLDLEAAVSALSARPDPEPLKVVLLQEMERYNLLLAAMARTLAALQKGIAGTVVITAELEAIFGALLVGRVPAAWGFCFPSLKPLGAWYRDMQARVGQMRGWAEVEMPRVFWLAGFTYPTGFLTALLQVRGAGLLRWWGGEARAPPARRSLAPVPAPPCRPRRAPTASPSTRSSSSSPS